MYTVPRILCPTYNEHKESTVDLGNTKVWEGRGDRGGHHPHTHSLPTSSRLNIVYGIEGGQPVFVWDHYIYIQLFFINNWSIYNILQFSTMIGSLTGRGVQWVVGVVRDEGTKPPEGVSKVARSAQNL